MLFSACNKNTIIINNKSALASPSCKLPLTNGNLISDFQDLTYSNVFGYNAFAEGDDLYIFGGGGLFRKNSSGETLLNALNTESLLITRAGTMLIGDDVGTTGNIKRKGINDIGFTTVLSVTDAVFYRTFRYFLQASDGKIFFALNDRDAANHFKSKIFMSNDDGLTWTDIGTFNAVAPTSLTIGALFENSQGIWAIGESRDWATWGDRTMHFYKWNGVTWVEENQLDPADPVTGLFTGSVFASNLINEPVVVYDDASYMTRATINGAFVYKVNPDASSGSVVSYFPVPNGTTYLSVSRIVVDQFGRFFMVKTESDNSTGQILNSKLLSSVNQGASWQEVGDLNFTNPITSFLDYGVFLNIDSEGTLHIIADTSDAAYSVPYQAKWTLNCIQQ